MTGPLASPGFWLHHAALVWRVEMDAALRPLDLTHTQFMLLASTGWLENEGGPPTQQQVAEYAGADRMMTSRVIRTLTDRGLLARETDDSDARALRLSVTDAGRTVARAAIAAAQDVDREFFGAYAERLRDMLRRIAELRPSP